MNRAFIGFNYIVFSKSKPDKKMKTKASSIILNQWRGLCTWTMAAATLSFLTMAGVVRAQVTNVIYQDTFARSGVLNGSAPDTVDANGATYIAGPFMFTGNWTDQNGNTENALYCSNSLPVPVNGPIYSDAFLPINVETNHIYTFTASFLVETNYGTFWMFMAYSPTPALEVVQQQWEGGMLIRSTNDPGTGNGNLQFFTGSGTGGGTTINFTPTSLIQPQFITLSVVLNLTNPAAILEQWFTNGVLIGSHSVGASLSGVSPNNGTWPHWIMFGQSQCSGWITNFTYTDVVPNPTGPTILEQPNNLTASQGQTATFWVNAAATPDPAYQWSLISGGATNAIAGATNATYTTPALSSSQNGVQYIVTMTNVAGSITSAPATLAVTAGNPTVYSAAETGNPNSLVVTFSGPVDPTTSQTAANYTLNNGASVTAASAGSASNNVVLTTSALTPGAAYLLTVKNVQDLFSDVMVASTNAVLPANLVLDLKGDSGVQLDGSGNIVQWLDATTNGNNAADFFGWSLFTAGFSASGPSTRPSTNTLINGLQALTFTAGNNDLLQIPPTSSTAINTNMTIYCVTEVSATGQKALVTKDIGNRPGSYEFDLNTYSPGVGPDFGNGPEGSTTGTTFESTPSGSGNPVGVPHVFAVTRTFIADYTNSWGGNAWPPALTNFYYTQSNTVSLYQDGVLTVANASLTEGAPGTFDGGEPT